MENSGLVQLTAEQIEKVFGPSAGFESGMGIIETGRVAGGLSTLFEIGFELLGNASAEVEPNDLVATCSVRSRLMGETAENLALYIPEISPIDREEVLSFSGRLDSFSLEGLYKELGSIDAIDFVEKHLAGFISAVIAHYLSRCGDMSDRSFSRALAHALSVIEEVSRTSSTASIGSVNKTAEFLGNLNVMKEIFALS
ncbi:MAG: hypothetical protein HKL84_04370 [Acidimicrobiaceae bacterium]|nr:hypothetical protein [Acidimicrobiaceae bacterium]